MFEELREINSRPKLYQFYTADELWANDHTSKQMLEYHLNESIDLSSRNKDFIDRSADWIVSRFGVNKTTEIADFGCGPGLYTTRFAECDAVVTGIDFSDNSLKYAEQIARQKGLKIDYVLKNYLNYETTKKFDLITMIMCDYCALSLEQRSVMLSKFYSLLKPGSYVLLDVYTENSFSEKEEIATYELNHLNSFWSPNDYYCFINTFKYEEEKVILDKYTIIEESKKRVVYNWLKYFSRESVVAEFEVSGFQVEEVYSDVSGTSYNLESPEIAVVARKIN